MGNCNPKKLKEMNMNTRAGARKPIKKKEENDMPTSTADTNNS